MKFFGNHLVTHGVVTESQVVEALDNQRRMTPPIGLVAREAAKLTVSQVYKVMNGQEETGERFLDTAVELGFLDEKDIRPLLRRQLEGRPQTGEILIEMGLITMAVMQKELQEFLGAAERDGEPKD